MNCILHYSDGRMERRNLEPYKKLHFPELWPRVHEPDIGDIPCKCALCWGLRERIFELETIAYPVGNKPTAMYREVFGRIPGKPD